MKIVVFNRFNAPKNLPSPSGSPIVSLFELKDNGHGLYVKEKVGETNNYLFIQENAKISSLSLLKSQLKKGDFSSLKESNGIYLDESQLPKNLNELHKFNHDISNFYDNNVVLKSIYKTKDDYINAVLNNSVIQNVSDFKNRLDSDYQKSIFEATRIKNVNVNPGSEKIDNPVNESNVDNNKNINK